MYYLEAHIDQNLMARLREDEMQVEQTFSVEAS